MFSVFSLLKFVLYACVFIENIALAEDVNHFIYHGFNKTSLQLGESAKIDSKGLLELTNISYQQIGRAFFPTPFKFNKSTSFSTTFVFAIVPEMPNLGGHGFAFVIAPSFNFPGALAVEWLGIFNENTNGLDADHVFAVEFDTIKTVGFQDINNNHVGIDVNSLISKVSAPAEYFSGMENKSLELISGKPMQAWIDYDDQDKFLNVTIAPLTSKKPERPLLSTTIDLSSVFLDSMYVGFSSSTGSMASHHYVLGWSFNTSGPAENLDISNLPSVSSPRKSEKKPDFTIKFTLITASVVLLLVSGAFYIFRRKKFDELREDWETEYGPHRFSYKDLYKATKGFKEKELLGFGGFGKVYRGVIPSSNTQIAVKKFSHESQQGMKEFVAEIASMGRLRHRNLVQLLGYCRRKGELLLVYDYMPNGSLDKFLFNNEVKMNWFRRFKILKGVASALLYLHEEWEQVVLHRDVKASNVMLDAELNARLGDFGLAKVHDHGSIPQTTCVVGTVGYLAPEVSRTGRVTTSSDVFAFGVLMLEVACGRRPVEPGRTPQEMILVDWVLDCWKKGAILEISDPRLEGKFMVEEMELVLKLGLLCTQSTPACRPNMRQVVQYLDRKAVLPEIPSVDLVRDRVEYNLSLTTITDYSALSITDSILSCGR
ncbi:L-type lectin-domain containing receptor kinase IV.2-like [Euphorbia lathyris]|uniref:L-type lectin-domain containing receptor kinase IV.2-like n=1 Tax=Euphorbia lathyris TaxID=212925 RepID=UPI003313EFC4